MTDSDRQPVTEWTRIGLHTADIVTVRVAVEPRQRLQESGQVLHRQKAKGSQCYVESARNVALGENEAVPLGIVHRLRRDVEHRPVQRRQDVNSGEITTNVSGTC